MSKADDRAEERILLPAQQARLVGHERAREEILRAFLGGRAHHAWLISGSAGVGKATLAWHMARLLLAFPGDALANAPDSGVGPEHVVFQKMAAGAHADFFLLRRQRDARGNLRRQIVVEDARALGHFLALKSASGGRRVVIVDAADEMNASAANAILKLLEEPPARTYFFLLCHAPGRLLPTIRSRCLHLRLSPLAEDEVRAVLRQVDVPELAGVDDDALAQAVRMSGGSAGRALDLLLSKASAVWQQVAQALDKGDEQALQAASLRAAQALAPAEAQADMALFMELLRAWGWRHMQQAARAGDAAGAARWAEALTEIERRHAALEAVNLDRRQFLQGAIQRLAKMNRTLATTA